MSLTDWNQLFFYDSSSPTGLRWAVDIYNSDGKKTACGNVGEVAGTTTELAAPRVGVDGDNILCHIIVWELHYGEIPTGMFIDHFDGNEQNNSIENLRCVSRAINNRNKKKYLNNTSGVTGVKQVGGDWVAQWQVPKVGRKQKSFSKGKYGEAEAFRLACEYRAKMIEQLNAEGAGYTEDHGKR